MRNLLSIIIFILLLSPICASSHVFPSERDYQWELSGYSNQISIYDTLNVLNSGLINDGIYSNDEAMDSLILGISSPTVIYFPSGIYKFSKTISLKSNVIVSGENYKQTKLIFDMGGSNDLIRVNGLAGQDTFNVVSEIYKNDSAINIQDVSELNIGDFILIFDIDEEKITSDWAKKSTGQICQIKNINSNTVIIESKIRRDYKLSDNPLVIKIVPTQNSGIENLSIERLDSTISQTSNINFLYANNCFIKCIESKNCNFSHIEINKSTNILVEGSYFHDAFAYGGGGQGYGIMIQNSSGQCLVYNNIFRHLRHSMILQSGANGNVFAYNYSIEPFWTDVSLPSNSAGDMVLHGNYPYANLFEGNVCQNIVIDDSHGKNGPHNTFFRNRAKLYGIFMNTNPASDNQSFIGNEITNSDFLKGLYLLNGTGHFEYGNNIRGNIVPEGTNELNDISYYLADPPDWFKNYSHYPPIGSPNSIEQYSIESEERYKQEKYTACDDVTNVEDLNIVCSELSIFPNPSSVVIFIKTERKANAQLYSILGIKITDIKTNEEIEISGLPTSVYYVLVNNKSIKFLKL